MAVRLPRWTWLLVLPLLVGALLLTHGPDAHASAIHPGAASAASVVPVHPHGDGEMPADHGCGTCMAGHVMAACGAIVTAIGGVVLVRRLLARPGVPILAGTVAARVRGLVEPARPPDPAWVRLSVMRC